MLRTYATRLIPRPSPSRLATLPTKSLALRGAQRRLVPQPLGYKSHPFSSTSQKQAKYVKFQVDPNQPLDVSKWDLGTKILVSIGVGGAVYYLAHLERVPETGRWRFMDISPKYEAQLATEARNVLLQEHRGKTLPPNHPITRHVRRVVSRLLEANDLGTLRPQDLPPAEVGFGTGEVPPAEGGREWNLIVVNDDRTVNAAALYGNVIVFTGILPVAKDEQGLAAVLGHEIGHVVARHNSESYSKIKVLIFMGYLLQAVLGIDFGIIRLATSLLIDLPHSRTLEYEADKIGLRISSKACYEPQAAPEMFKRLAQLEEGFKISFLQTHPASEKRVQELEAMLPEAENIRAMSSYCGAMADAYSGFSRAFASGLGFGSRSG